MYKKQLVILLILVLATVYPFQAKPFTLSDHAKISILTCGPNDEIYALYGHTAIRVNDPAFKVDLVFNYGVFSFAAPHFVYRFAKGETDYMLSPFKFGNFFEEYKKDQRSIYEQDLNLTQKEKQQLFNFLIWNAKEENREYRYNFLFDNCASRVRDVMEKQVDGKIIFPEKSKNPKTFRQLIKEYHEKMHWLNFGIDLVVCAPADQQATAYEEMFLPDYLMDHFAHATIQSQTETKPLVNETRTLFQAPEKKQPGFSIISPFIIFFLLCGLVVGLSFYQFRKNKISDLTDYLVYGINGLMGFALLWFVLYSEHPAMHPNYNLLWAMPLNLVFTFVWMIKKWRPVSRYYHIFMLGWMLLFILFSPFLPQWFHPAFYFFVLIVMSRALLHSLLIFKKGKQNPEKLI